MNREDAIDYIKTGLNTIYQKAKDGKDVSPAQRLRLEGQADLLVDMQLLDRQQLRDLVNTVFTSYFDKPVEKAFWQWADELDYTVIPFYMQEAPVYKEGGN